MGKPKGSRGGRKRPPQSESSEQISRKPKKEDNAHDVEMSEERGASDPVERKTSTTEEMHTSDNSPPVQILVDTPGPRSDRSFEYFERGIMDVSNLPEFYDSDDSLPTPQTGAEEDVFDLIPLIHDPEVAIPIPSSSHALVDGKIEQPTSKTSDQAPAPALVDVSEEDIMMMNQDQEPNAVDEEVGHHALKAESHESDTSRAARQDVCGHRGWLTPSPALSIASLASQALPPAPPPTPATSVATMIPHDSSLSSPIGQVQENVPQQPEEPLAEQAANADDDLPHPNTEEGELERIKTACRKMFEDEWQFTGDTQKSRQPITPYHWIEFRKRVIMNGELRIDGEQFLRVEEDSSGLGVVIYKTSASNPICSLPSCFSTDGTTSRANTRCSEHHGNVTSYAVMELVFHEVVLGRTVAVGVEHVLLMFSHYRNDPKVELNRRSVEEYSTSGLLDETVRRLKKKRLKRSAKDLRTTRSATVRRQWIFRNLQLACNHFYVVAMACCLVCKNLGTSRTPSIGYFRGQHLENITRNFYLEGNVSPSIELTLYTEIDLEQFRTYGVATPIKSIIYDSLL